MAAHPPGGTAGAQGACSKKPAKETLMLWTIAILLLVLWLFGLVSSYTLGGYIHILIILAVVAVLVRLIQGRRL
jgi:hypothetical protein